MHELKFDTPEALIELMAQQGGTSYFGEPVTVLEHCLQAAHFAGRESSPNELVIAALLHDIGHLLHREGENAAEDGLDTRHEELAEHLLAAHLPQAVTEPIRLHVAAKRYLCFADLAYAQALSPSSQLSLNLQGGPMSRKDAEEFLGAPFAREAVALRLWDDEAKIPDLPVPPLEDYIPQLKTLWR